MNKKQKGKDTGEDKQLRKELESKILEEIEELKSPEFSFSSSLVSPFGPLDQTASRRTFFNLFSTLNALFPNYDFKKINKKKKKKKKKNSNIIDIIFFLLINKFLLTLFYLLL